MKIVHVINGLGDGGAEAILYRLCVGEKTHAHHVVSLMDGGKYGELLKKNGVRVTCLDMPQGRLTIGGLMQLWGLLRRERPACVQTWMYHSNLIGGVIAKISGVKNIYWGIHHTALNAGQSKRSTILVARLGALLSPWIPVAIVCCAQKAFEIHRELGYEKKSLRVIFNGYDVVRFSHNSKARAALRYEWHVTDKPLIGMIGRFDPLKDHKNLLAALSLLKISGFSFSCVLAGKGIDRENRQLVDWIDEFDLQENLILLGQRNDIPEVMSALDFHVLSSRSEAFPNVLAEAMACGTPSVTTDVGDAAAIVGESGWVVPPADFRALAAGLENALDALKDTDSWNARCARARRLIEENLTLDRMIKNYDELWRRGTVE
ncbi:glycosyltransferase involved in cell wall biosynthesis [Variovorax boronicumulans]|uniref:glycosyltransferase family 4 protein n=1 Tax=Variovorax boronicumulans TaxID=436515 RepID=UPI00277E4633|nr:glycosyltransferase [Variovorax boronicumulans]MDP9916409.1 glycosyltransferase involved in cell wall biosynthesis [Variovorax boronicumulans]